MKTIHTFLISALLLSSCTMVKRYRTAQYESTPSRAYVTMGLFSATLSQPKEDNSKTLWDLEGEGQGMLIDKLEKKYPLADDFTEQLNNSYLEEPVELNFTTKKIKLIFSVTKIRDYAMLNSSNSFSLADRIEFLKFDLSIDNPAYAQFITWNKLETDFAVIDIADVTFEQSLESTLGVGSEEPKINAELKGSLKRTEAQKIKYRYAVLNGRISPAKIEVEEEGTREIDLNGNVVVELTIKLAASPGYYAEFENLKDAHGVYSPLSAIKLHFNSFLSSSMPVNTDLTATLNYSYIYRNVKNKKGANTFIESDDDVKYMPGSASATGLSLLKANDIKVREYWINLDGLPIGIKRGINNSINLCFNSQEKAETFCNWLLNYVGTHSTDPNILFGTTNELQYNGSTLTPARIIAGAIVVYKN